MMMTMDNGKMERKEIDDTSIIVAWFTTDIPVSAGPEVQGQLPGLILGLETKSIDILRVQLFLLRASLGLKDDVEVVEANVNQRKLGHCKTPYQRRN